MAPSLCADINLRPSCCQLRHSNYKRLTQTDDDCFSITASMNKAENNYQQMNIISVQSDMLKHNMYTLQLDTHSSGTFCYQLFHCSSWPCLVFLLYCTVSVQHLTFPKIVAEILVTSMSSSVRLRCLLWLIYTHELIYITTIASLK